MVGVALRVRGLRSLLRMPPACSYSELSLPKRAATPASILSDMSLNFQAGTALQYKGSMALHQKSLNPLTFGASEIFEPKVALPTIN